MAFSRLLQVNVTVGGAVTETSLMSSISYDGVTFTFDRAMPVGAFVTGEPFVVSDQAFQITSISPSSALINGKVAHGTMKDPYFTNADPQGFDQMMDTANLVRLSYDPVANVDPGNTGSSILIALGEDTTIVKSVRRSAVTTDNSWQTIEAYVPLTVLSAAPPTGCFRPSMSGTTKRLYTISDIDLSVFRSLSFPPALSDSPAALLADLPTDPGNFGMTGEAHRRLRLDVTAGHGLTLGNYSADIAPAYGKACAVMHNAGYTDADKQALLYRLVTWGIQLDGLYDRGWRGIGGYRGGAGQSFAWTPYFWLTAFVLQSASMLAKVKGCNQPFDNCRWITEANIDTAPGFQSGNRGTPFFDEHLNTPFCFPDYDVGSQYFSRYGYIATFGMIWDSAPVMLLQNGPSGETGFSARNDGAYDAANDKSAVWAMNDRTVTLNPWAANGYNAISSAADELWKDVVQPAGIHTPWIGVPEMLHQGNLAAYFGDNGDFFTATTGGFSWDFSGYNYATEAKTGRAFRYSLDGTQWMTDETVADADSVSGLLPGATHYLSFRWQSASGWGAWLPNYRVIDDDISPVVPNVIATLGSGTVTVPSFAVSPVIHAKIKEVWGDNPGNWAPAPSALGVDQLQLKCGLGYVTGDATPSFTFQWKRDGVDIPGATAQTYDRVAADAEAVLTCDVTPSNTAGTGATVTTAGITCPAVQSPPAGTLIDTDFRGRFAIDYEAEYLDVLTNSNYSVSHQPTESQNGFEGVDVGALKFTKTGAWPSASFLLARLPDSSGLYDLSAQVFVADDGYADRASFVFEVWEEGGAVLFSDAVRFPGDDADGDKKILWDISGQFTTTMTSPLAVRVGWSNGTGGSAGGTPHLHRLRISEA